MLEEMKVLVRDSMFCVENPKADKEIDSVGELNCVSHDEYARFTMQYESKEEYPALFKYLANLGVRMDETILLEFD
jgi:hypothetical protein